MMIMIRSCPCADDDDKDDSHDAERPLQVNTTTPAGLTMLDDADHDDHEENYMIFSWVLNKSMN